MPPKKKEPKRRLPTIRIGHLSITLLPGESSDRIQEITDAVWNRWQPANIVEEFDCDMLVHAIFKIERYQRFREQFVASGIEEIDLDRAMKAYQSTVRTTERSLAIARENEPRPAATAGGLSAELLADMPVDGPVQ